MYFQNIPRVAFNTTNVARRFNFKKVLRRDWILKFLRSDLNGVFDPVYIALSKFDPVIEWRGKNTCLDFFFIPMSIQGQGMSLVQNTVI